MKTPVQKTSLWSLLACLILTFAEPVSPVAGGQYFAVNLGFGRAYDINSSRTVTGTSISGGVQRAFSYSGGVMTDLGVLSGLDSSIGYAINEFDNVVGVSFSSDGSGGYPHGFRYKIDTMADIGTLGYATYAYDINNVGVVVGESVKNEMNFPSHAFAVTGGVLTDLGTLGGLNSAAAGINSAGTIVGWADTSNGVTHAFSYTGVMTDLGDLGGGSSHATDINDAGVVVGWSSVAGGNDHAFLYSGGLMTDLAPGGGNSYANAINSFGVVVGNRDGRAFVYHDGVLTDLSPLLVNLGIVDSSEALGINDQGDIVGAGRDASGQEIAFLLAVPEPSTTAMLILAVAGWAIVKRKAMIARG